MDGEGGGSGVETGHAALQGLDPYCPRRIAMQALIGRIFAIGGGVVFFTAALKSVDTLSAYLEEQCVAGVGWVAPRKPRGSGGSPHAWNVAWREHAGC